MMPRKRRLTGRLRHFWKSETELSTLFHEPIFTSGITSIKHGGGGLIMWAIFLAAIDLSQSLVHAGEFRS